MKVRKADERTKHPARMQKKYVLETSTSAVVPFLQLVL